MIVPHFSQFPNLPEYLIYQHIKLGSLEKYSEDWDSHWSYSIYATNKVRPLQVCL